jgi:hypothetical protein
VLYDSRTEIRVPPVMGKGGVVPYIAMWSEERTLPTHVVQRQLSGVGYADEGPSDRDRDGVLWTRVASRPGEGRPEYARLHPRRQRRAMRLLLCQVCAEPAEYTGQGHLWLLTDHRQDWAHWPEDVVNPYPPVCLSCARLSVRLCPPLRRGFVLVRAHSMVHGVIGVLFRPGQTFPAVELAEDDDGKPVAHTDPAIQWTQATQLTRTLHRCTPVDLDQVAP